MGMDFQTADEIVDYLAGQLGVGLVPQVIPAWGSMCIDSPRTAIIAIREALARSNPEDLIEAHQDIKLLTDERNAFEREAREAEEEAERVNTATMELSDEYDRRLLVAEEDHQKTRDKLAQATSDLARWSYGDFC
jgi:hypothetical protein